MIGLPTGGMLVSVIVVVDVVVPPAVGVVGTPVEAVVAVPVALDAVVPEVLGSGDDDALEAAVPEVLATLAVPLALFLALALVRLVIFKIFLKLLSNNIIVT